MNDVVLDNAVEDVTANEAEFTVNGGHGALDESPVLGIVVSRILVGVVQIGDGNYAYCQFLMPNPHTRLAQTYRPSGSSRDMEGRRAKRCS